MKKIKVRGITVYLVSYAAGKGVGMDGRQYVRDARGRWHPAKERNHAIR